MKHAYLFSFIFVLILENAGAIELSVTVAVSANMQFAFTDISAASNKETGIVVKQITVSSGKLAAQIQSGAPFDVFISADTLYPQRLYAAQLTSGAPEIYAYGVLVMWTLKDIDLTNGLALLADASISRIALANPRLAPYGLEAMHAIESSTLKNKLQTKLILAENIGQVNQYVTTRAVDIGFTAKSVVLAPAMKNIGRWKEVAAHLYTPISQSAVILKRSNSTNMMAAQ